MLFSSRINLCGKPFLRTLYFGPLTYIWRSAKTDSGPLESRESFRDSVKAEIKDHEARLFENIPGPKTGFMSIVEFYRKTEGFTKSFKLADSFFAEYGPIYKENIMLGPETVHVIDPADFERVFRAEGKYPRRPLVDAWVECRKRNGYLLALMVT